MVAIISDRPGQSALESDLENDSRTEFVWTLRQDREYLAIIYLDSLDETIAIERRDRGERRTRRITSCMKYSISAATAVLATALSYNEPENTSSYLMLGAIAIGAILKFVGKR